MKRADRHIAWLLLRVAAGLAVGSNGLSPNLVMAHEGLVASFDAREIRSTGSRRDYGEAAPPLIAKGQIQIFPEPVPGQVPPPEASPTPQDSGGFLGPSNAARSATAPDSLQPETPVSTQSSDGSPPPVIYYHIDYVPPVTPPEGPPPNVQVP